MTIEVRHLRYLIAAAEGGSFRRAAKTLKIEQSAVSRRIRDLEDEVGTTLFIRRPYGVQLTDAGRRFVERAREALGQISHAAIDAGSFGRAESGRVRIGIFSSLASGFLADLLSAYIEANPTIRPDLIESGPLEHIAAIRRGKLDVAFLTGQPEARDCELTHLWSERVFVAMHRDDVLSQKREIVWDQLKYREFIVSEADPGPEIHDYLVKHLAELGHHPHVERHAVGRDNLMHLVAIGRGLTLTSEATIGTRFPGIVYRPLSAELLPFSAVWSRVNDNPALRRLLHLATTMSKRATSHLETRRAPNAATSILPR